MQDVHNNNSSAKNNEIMMDNLTDNNNLEVNKSDEEENGLPNLIQFNTQMKQVFFGSTGMKISEVGLGGMTFGMNTWNMPNVPDEITCYDMLDLFISRGGNFIDTADSYGYGSSEEVIGRWLKRTAVNRDDLVLSTKVFYPSSTGANRGGLSRKHILSAVDQSLKRLNVEYIDLYQLHCFDSGTPLKETLTTLHDLVRSGKVRYIGASNFTGWQLQKAITMSEMMGLEVLSSYSPQYNLLSRSIEWELFPVCRNEGLALLPWSPLKGGWLTGKYLIEEKKAPVEGRVAWSQAVGWVLEEVKKIAKETGKTMAQVSIRWVMQRPSVTSPIIGASSLQQLHENLGAIGWKLTNEQMKRLNEVSGIALPYPYNVIKNLNESYQRRRLPPISIPSSPSS